MKTKITLTASFILLISSILFSQTNFGVPLSWDQTMRQVRNLMPNAQVYSNSDIAIISTLSNIYDVETRTFYWFNAGDNGRFYQIKYVFLSDLPLENATNILDTYTKEYGKPFQISTKKYDFKNCVVFGSSTTLVAIEISTNKAKQQIIQSIRYYNRLNPSRFSLNPGLIEQIKQKIPFEKEFQTGSI